MCTKWQNQWGLAFFEASTYSTTFNYSISMNYCYNCITVPFSLTSGGYNGAIITEKSYDAVHTEIKPILIKYSTVEPARLEAPSVNRYILCLIIGSV